MSKEKETVAKQLSIVQDYKFRFIYSSKKVNFLKITAQLGIPYMWRGGANLAEKMPRWCGGAMIQKVAHVAVAQT